MLIHLTLTILVFAILLYFMVMPRRNTRKPPQGDDEGGEPLRDGLPDLDLPPGISRPLNDWEPDYSQHHDRQPANK